MEDFTPKLLIFEAFRSGDAVQLRAAVLKSYDGWKDSLYRIRTAAPNPAKEQDG